MFRCTTSGWIYCDQSLSTACQFGGEGFKTYASAEILGNPPISSTGQIATTNSRLLTTSTSVTKSAASITLTNPPTCTGIIHQSALPAIAIGVGLGVPFGIAAIGFLVFLFWRDARSKSPRGSKQDRLGDKRTRGHNTTTDGETGGNGNTLLDGETDGNENSPADGEMDGNGLQLELQGTMITAELHGNEMVQQPYYIAPPALEPRRPSR